MDKKVGKIKRLNGELIIPPDKSISHRSVMFTSLAKGKSVINNFSHGADCLSTMNLFKSLGVDIKEIGENTLEVISKGVLTPQTDRLDCGNSGTTMRLCSGILAGQNFNSVLFGDESLSKRPMKRIIAPLELMGAKIVSDDYKAPLEIYGQPLHGINYNSPIASAQVKSCLLLAGLNAEGTTCVTEPYTSRNHTELMLKYLGVCVEVNGCTVSIEKSKPEPRVIDIAGDISSAAYFIVGALIVPDSDIIIKNVGLNPTRTGIIDIVKRMGGQIEILDKKEVSGEIVGDIRVKYSELKGCNISGDDIPRLIDELPVIALLATQAVGVTTVSDSEDLRKKESDRITTIVNGLNSLGANLTEKQDGFIVNGKTKLHGNKELEVFHDHRLAMTYYVAGLICEKEILIKEFQWVNISFPEFLDIFDRISIG